MDNRSGRLAFCEGGNAIAVKASVGRHCVVLPLRGRRNIEATEVEFSEVLGSVLWAPAYNKPAKAEVLDVDLDTVFRAHGKIILPGDLCCKQGGATAGWVLYWYLQAQHLGAYGSGHPNFYPCARGTRPDVLDIA